MSASAPPGKSCCPTCLPNPFDIPFDRQQLADFLCVERAAMSVELSKLQKEGLLVTKRNHFELLTH